MFRKRTQVLFLTALLLFLSACGGQTAQTSPTPSEEETTPSTIIGTELTAFSLTVGELSELVEAEEGDDIEILDATTEQILFAVSRDYELGEDGFTEEGYSAYTKAVILYNWNENRVTRYPMEETVYCTYGAISGDSFAFVLLELDGLYSRYSLQYGENGTLTELDRGEGYSDPQIISLGDGVYAYSFFDEESSTFGVKLLEQDKTFRTVISYQEVGVTKVLGNRLYGDSKGNAHYVTIQKNGTTKFISNELYGNGNRFLYHATVEDVDTMFVGDRSGLLSQFTMEEGERLRGCALLSEDIFFPLYQEEEITGSTMIAVKAQDGTTRMKKQYSPSLYRPVSDGASSVMAINGSYQIYSISVGEDAETTVTRTSYPQSPVMFYGLEPGVFLVHYYSLTEADAECLFLHICS